MCDKPFVGPSVAFPVPGGSGFKSPDWIRILQVKLSYKNPLFQQFFHDFHFGGNQKFHPKFCYCLWKNVFMPGSGLRKNSRIRIRKKRITGSATLVPTRYPTLAQVDTAPYGTVPSGRYCTNTCWRVRKVPVLPVHGEDELVGGGGILRGQVEKGDAHHAASSYGTYIWREGLTSR